MHLCVSIARAHWRNRCNAKRRAELKRPRRNALAANGTKLNATNEKNRRNFNLKKKWRKTKFARNHHKNCVGRGSSSGGEMHTHTQSVAKLIVNNKMWARNFSIKILFPLHQFGWLLPISNLELLLDSRLKSPSISKQTISIYCVPSESACFFVFHRFNELLIFWKCTHTHTHTHAGSV